MRGRDKVACVIRSTVRLFIHSKVLTYAKTLKHLVSHLLTTEWKKKDVEVKIKSNVIYSICLRFDCFCFPSKILFLTVAKLVCV